MSRSRWRMPPRVAAGGGLGGQPAARLVSSNPAEAVFVGARGSGAQTNRERWRESAERSHSATSGVATTENRSEEQERERSEETRLESWRCCEARRDLLKERCEESRPRKVAAKPPGAFELRTSGSTSGLARGDCRGPAAHWLTPKPNNLTRAPQGCE